MVTRPPESGRSGNVDERVVVECQASGAAGGKPGPGGPNRQEAGSPHQIPGNKRCASVAKGSLALPQRNRFRFIHDWKSRCLRIGCRSDLQNQFPESLRNSGGLGGLTGLNCPESSSRHEAACNEFGETTTGQTGGRLRGVAAGTVFLLLRYSPQPVFGRVLDLVLRLELRAFLKRGDKSRLGCLFEFGH
jgi:hypothetical protein